MLQDAMPKSLIEKSNNESGGLFFGSLKENQKILLPWLFISFVLLLGFFIIGDFEVSFELRNIIQRSASVTEIRAAKVALFIDKILLMLNPLLIAVIGFLLLKNNYYLNFRKVLALMIYGESIYYCGVLLSIPIVLLTGILNPFSLAPVALNYGCEPSSLLYFLSLKLDVFFILQILFVGIGVTKMTHCNLMYGFKVSMLSVGLLSMIIFFLKLIMEISD